MKTLKQIDLVFRFQDGNDIQVGIFNDGADGINVSQYADRSTAEERGAAQPLVDAIVKAVEEVAIND